MIRFSHCMLYVLPALVLFSIGCRSTPKPESVVDASLVRFAKSGSDAFAEGDVDSAVKEYRKALGRAWAIDDPYESGTAAYNLAACLMSQNRIIEARDWLVDARVEFCRSETSCGNTWLLEAKIAQHEGCLDEMRRCIDLAACTKPPCQSKGSECLCNAGDACQESCRMKIPCVGKKFKRKKEIENCEKDYLTQVHLSRARHAAETYDLAKAHEYFSLACDLARDVCSEGLQAELQNAAALIHLASEEYLHAAIHFDKEAEHLRHSGNYREIPAALEAASAAYTLAGRGDLAASRLCRVARIWYGRGDAEKSWRFVQDAIALCESSNSEAARIRLSLVANEIQQTLKSRSPDLP